MSSVSAPPAPGSAVSAPEQQYATDEKTPIAVKKKPAPRMPRKRVLGKY